MNKERNVRSDAVGSLHLNRNVMRDADCTIRPSFDLLPDPPRSTRPECPLQPPPAAGVLNSRNYHISKAIDRYAHKSIGNAAHMTDGPSTLCVILNSKRSKACA